MKGKYSNIQSQYWIKIILLVLLLLIALAEFGNARGDGVYDDKNNVKLTPHRKSSLKDKSVQDPHDDIVAAFRRSQHHHRHEQHSGQNENHLPPNGDVGGKMMKKRNPDLNELNEEVENQKSGESGEEEGIDMEGTGNEGEEEPSGEENGVYYQFHRKMAHQEVVGETQDGEQGGDSHHHHHSVDEEEYDNDENNHSGANDGSGHDFVVEEMHIHHDEPQHIESHHASDNQGAKSEWQHFHASHHDDSSGDDESGDKESEGSHSAEGEDPQSRHKETTHKHHRVYRHHGKDVHKNSKHVHQHEDETSDNESDSEHSGNHDGSLSNHVKSHTSHEKGEDAAHHGEESSGHSAEGASGDDEDHEEEMGKHGFEQQQVHKVKHKAVNPHRLDAAKHHHVHVHHQHQGIVQKSTAIPSAGSVTEGPTKPTEPVGNANPEGPDSDIYIDENKKAGDEAEEHQVEIVQANQQKVSCSHDDRTITNGTVVYVRAECRLCQCITGTLLCEAMSASCTNHKALSCMLERGGLLKDGDIHFDGCNRCLCQNGALLCTRLRCKSSGYNYTNYARSPDNGKLDRGRDPCLECDYEPISAVCGSNGKTYRSLCHAFLCAGLGLEDLDLGACEDLDPCQNHDCKRKNQICMANQQTPCLTVKTSAGKKLNCPRYKCVAIKESCPLQSEPDQVVCGIDGQTYPTECHLVSNSVLLAYRGSCRKACIDGDYQVCGVDAMTFESPCQANLYNQYIDYKGSCESYAAKPDVIVQEEGPDLYVNRRCSRLDKGARCPDLTCQEVVTPQGTCCPVCGAALSIRLDTAVQDMTDLKVVRPAQDLNSLDAVYTAIANLQDANTLDKCSITVDLADTNDVVSTFVPKNPYDLKSCTDAARNTVKKVCSKTNRLDPYQALLASAVLVELYESGKSIVVNDGAPKRRVKRSVHHEHEPVFSTPGNITSAAMALQMTHSSCSFGKLILFSLMSLYLCFNELLL